MPLPIHNVGIKTCASFPRQPSRHGFALLITITLVAFLVLILVTLASLTRVETSVATNSQTQAQARQNALMALNLAIGELQKYTGPDQRVTATADLQPLAAGATTDPASGVSLAGTSTILNSIDTFWRDSRNRRWTGAWRASDPNLSSFNADTPSASILPPTQLNWLVSGNESTANTFTPNTKVDGLTLAAVTAAGAGTTPLYDAANKPYQLLVGANTVNITAATDLDRAVVAPRVDIQSQSVQGLTGNQTVGHYAWWVGDEGVKARANLTDAYATDTSAKADRTHLQSPQRAVLEAMTVTGAGSGTDDQKGLAPFASTLANNPDLKKIISASQLSTLQSSTIYQSQIKKRWHELTNSSRGVLSDTRHGGLKHDLSYLLSRPTLSSLHTALGNTLPGFAPNTAATDYNRILSTTATPFATQPPSMIASGGAFNGNNVYQTMDMFTYSATWEQLWSYYNMGNSVTPASGTPAGVFTTADEVRPRVQSGTQEGIYPLLVQVKLFYKLRIPGGTLDPDGVDRTNNIWMDIIPVVVLANPYNVKLEAQNYILRSVGGTSSRVRLYYGLNPADPENLTLSPSSPSSNELSITNSGMGEMKLTIKAPTMEPGRAYVFTLEQPQTVIPATTAAQKLVQVNMVNDFNQGNVLTFDTTKRIAALPATHAALTTDNGMIAVKLYTSDYTDTLADRTMIRYILPHTYVADSASNTILVYPLSEGVRHGGGLNAFIHDASNVANSQQATSYQVNYRSLVLDNAAYTSFGTNPNGTGQKDISISWARTRLKSGATSLPGNDTPNEFIQANLLWRDASDPKEVRWGIYNTGEGYDGTVVPTTLAGDTGLVNILYDLPRASNPPSAISQLRHFNTAGHIPLASWDGTGFANKFSIVSHSFQPNLPIGNSYPNPYIIRQKVIDGDGGMGFQYDGSYLFNDALMDRFYFSSYPGTGNFDFATDKLINNRNRPFRQQSSVAWNDPANFRTDSLSAAKNLLVDGAFNINSTSIDAWKALLTSVRDIPVGGETIPANLTAPFARTLFQTGAATASRAGNTENAWTGTINLTTSEIDQLAREIVLQIRRRGPFVSMADFTNRRLIAAASDSTFGLGLGGALQSAIDRIFNQTTDVQPVELRTQSNNRTGGNLRLADNAYVMPTGISGFSGYILQSDILASVGPVLSARSDTFTIRTYGDVQNPVTGEVTGRAWCEAIVQRTPDYVVPASAGGNTPDEIPAAGSANETFGRRYEVVSFRWLTPTDL